MISRSMGAGFGGSVGLLFAIGYTTGGAMYIVGLIEAFKGITRVGNFINKYDDMRILSWFLLTIITFVVYKGVKIVSNVASLLLFFVVLAIISI